MSEEHELDYEQHVIDVFRFVGSVHRLSPDELRAELDKMSELDMLIVSTVLHQLAEITADHIGLGATDLFDLMVAKFAPNAGIRSLLESPPVLVLDAEPGEPFVHRWQQRVHPVLVTLDGIGGGLTTPRRVHAMAFPDGARCGCIVSHLDVRVTWTATQLAHTKVPLCRSAACQKAWRR